MSETSGAAKIALEAEGVVIRSRFVKAGSSDGSVAPVALSSDIPLGVAEHGASAGEMTNVLYRGVVRIEVGTGGVTRGSFVRLDATDQNGAIEDAVALALVAGGTTDNNGISGNYPQDGPVVGVALESGTSGQFVLVMLK